MIPVFPFLLHRNKLQFVAIQVSFSGSMSVYNKQSFCTSIVCPHWPRNSIFMCFFSCTERAVSKWIEMYIVRIVLHIVKLWSLSFETHVSRPYALIESFKEIGNAILIELYILVKKVELFGHHVLSVDFNPPVFHKQHAFTGYCCHSLVLIRMKNFTHAFCVPEMVSNLYGFSKLFSTNWWVYMM